MTMKPEEIARAKSIISGMLEQATSFLPYCPLKPKDAQLVRDYLKL